MSCLKTLYTLTKTGKIQEWDIAVRGDEIHVTFGQQGGKKNTKITKATPKNIGRANETTAEEQAWLEAESKWKKQLRTGYATSIEELGTREVRLPMLAADYTKVGHRIIYPCYVSRKLDGLRCTAFVESDGSVTLLSRGGKEYDVPHIKTQVKILSEETGIMKFDGELYIHGVPLQTITSLAKKKQKGSENLVFVIFDCPSEDVWVDRYLDVLECLAHIRRYGTQFSHLSVVENDWVDSEVEARMTMDKYLSEGYEGLMLRNFNGRYMWGTRNGDLQKWKDMKDTEAKVISVTEDKNGEGVLRCILESGVTFECKMKGTHDFRKFSNMLTLIGKYVNVKYQTLTEDGSLQFPVGMYVRECDEKGNPID